MRSTLRRPASTLLALALATTGLAGGVLGAAPARAATCPSSGGVSVPNASASGDVVFRGHGWGHGLGMSQYGAQGAARLGCTATQILTRYYTGTTVGAATMPATVMVRMLKAGYRVDVTTETGAASWELEGCTTGCPPVQPKGANWQLKLADNQTTFVLLDLDAPAGPSRTVWKGGSSATKLWLRHSGTVVHETTWSGSSIYLERRLRWDTSRFTIATTGTQRLEAVQLFQNHAGPLPDVSGMDKYLWGIAEVPISWTNGAQEALQAQAIAARTYAAKRPGAALMPTPADQNYTGYAKESEDASFRDSSGRNLRWRQAVQDTSGKVVKNSSTGGLIDCFYSSSVGGWSEDERYVWGPEASFLRPVDDSRWDLASDNPAKNRSWAKGYSFSTLAGRFGFSSLSAISVPRRGTVARNAGVKLTGIKGGRLTTSYLTGWDVRQALGLLSPGFEITVNAIGGTAATPIVGDWNGDGTTDVGWWKNGKVALRMTDPTSTWVSRFTFGTKGDVPVVGDWNGDGTDDLGVYRAGTWYLRDSDTGAVLTKLRWGSAGDKPVVGSWNGSTLGFGVVRKGRWLLRDTVGQGPVQRSFVYGRATDVPFAGDWNGDHVSTPAIRRGGTWYVRDTVSGGAGQHIYHYGSSTDRGVVGDWDGNGRDSLGVARDRSFLLRNSPAGGAAEVTVAFSG